MTSYGGAPAPSSRPVDAGPHAPHAAESPTHWPAVLAAVGGGVAIGMNVGKVPLALPTLREAFGLDLVQAGYVSSTLSTVAVITAVGMGLLAGRVGALRMALAGLILGAIASLAGLFAQGYAALIATRVVEGAGFLAMAVAGPGLVTAAAAPQDRRFALGVWATFMPAGAGSAMALSPWLMAWGGWRAMWLLAAVALTLAALAVWLQRPRYASAGGSGHAPSGSTALRALRQPLAWVLAISFASWALQHFALIVWLPTFLKDQRGLGDGAVAALTAVMLLVNVPGNLLGGALLQRGVPRGRLLMIAHTLTGLCAIGLATDAWPDALRYALCLLLSFTGGLIPAAVLSSTTVLAAHPRQIGVLQGLNMQGSQIGQFVGTPLIAMVVAASGQWSSARWVTGGAAALGVALGWIALRAETRLTQRTPQG